MVRLDLYCVYWHIIFGIIRLYFWGYPSGVGVDELVCDIYIKKTISN